MSRKTKQPEKAPSTYRFMCLRAKSTNYSMSFETKDEALQYAESLDDPKIEWYGIYELDPECDYLKAVVSKRLLPYDDTIPERFLTKSDSDSEWFDSGESKKKHKRHKQEVESEDDTEATDEVSSDKLPDEPVNTSRRQRRRRSLGIDVTVVDLDADEQSHSNEKLPDKKHRKRRKRKSDSNSTEITLASEMNNLTDESTSKKRRRRKRSSTDQDESTRKKRKHKRSHKHTGE